MTVFVLGSFSGAALGWLMGFLSLFLIMLVLVQRGRGGGLAGTLGGPGGQSAFGSKSGDTFTVITVIAASIWGFVCAFTMWLLGTPAAPGELTDLDSGPAITATDTIEDPADGLVIPKMDGSGIGGIGSPEGGDTPSMDLTPANSDSTDTTPPAESSGSTPAETPESTPAETPESTPAEAPESTPAETPESPAAETPESSEPPKTTEPEE